MPSATGAETATGSATATISATSTEVPNSTLTATEVADTPTDVPTSSLSVSVTPTPGKAEPSAPVGTATTTFVVSSTFTATPTVDPTLTPAATARIGCAPVPLLGCRTPGGSRLTLKPPDRSGFVQLRWRWFHGAAAVSDFGDALHAPDAYRLCLYDLSTGGASLQLEASAPAGGLCARQSCWKQIGNTPQGFAYSDPERPSNGLVRILLKAGTANAKIAVSAKGADLSSQKPLNRDATLVQLVRSDEGMCWQDAYPPGTALENPSPTASSATGETTAGSPTATPLPTPISPPLVSAQCYAGAGGTTSGTEDYTGSPSDKIGAQVGRWLRDWATWIPKTSPVNGYESGTAVQPMLGLGPPGIPQTANGPWYPNQLVCAGDSNCSVDLMTDTSHCEEKVSYENQCQLQDWDDLWKWIGDPTMPVYGHCRDDASTALHAACQSDSDCTGYGPCIKKCDVFKFGNDPDATPADPLPPGSLHPAGVAAGRTAWEVCRCYAEFFTKPQIDEWLTDAQAVRDCAGGAAAGLQCDGDGDCSEGTCTASPTNACVSNAFNQMGNDFAQFELPYGCVGQCQKCDGATQQTCSFADGGSLSPCTFNSDCAVPGEACNIDPVCLTNVFKCKLGWQAAQVKDACQTCRLLHTVPADRAEDLTAAYACPTTCAPDNPQISCATWFSWCDSFLLRMRPLRYGLRERPGGAR